MNLQKHFEEFELDISQQYQGLLRKVKELSKNKNIYMIAVEARCFIDYCESIHSSSDRTEKYVKDARKIWDNCINILNKDEIRNIAIQQAKIDVKKTLDYQISNFIGGLPENIAKNLLANLASVLGFEDHFGRWEAKQGSNISTYISQKAKAKVKQIVEETITPEEIEKIKPEVKKAILEEYHNSLINQSRIFVKKEVEKIIPSLIQEYVDLTIRSLGIRPIRTDITLENPKTGDTLIEQEIMKDVIEKAEETKNE
jgi:hypothetical protein